MRMSSAITHKPPASTDRYESLEDIPLHDAAGNPSGFFIGAASYLPNPIVEIDAFERSTATLEIIAPDGSAERVAIHGPSEMAVYFEGDREGDALDDDRDGRDEVAAELTDLMLSGHSAVFGPMTLALNPARVSLGEMEEQLNDTPGLLDLPPFAPTGVADSFFDVEASGIRLQNLRPMRMSSAITHKPPASTDRYESLEDIPLHDASANPSGFFIGAASYVPAPIVEVDRSSHSTATVEIIAPDGTAETVQLYGPSEMQVYFEGIREGDALDDDGNGRDEVATELTHLMLSGQSPVLGSVTLELNPAQLSSGAMEEQVNDTSGVLDLPPFAETGRADSFFDVFFVTHVLGIQLHNVTPMRMSSAISHKPPASTDRYESLENIELLDASGNRSGFFMGATSYNFIPEPRAGSLMAVVTLSALARIKRRRSARAAAGVAESGAESPPRLQQAHCA
jgi:hypothetical protein